MNRVEFTRAKTKLLQMMIDEGEQPIEDYLKRSDEEQHRLWKIGRDEDGNKVGVTVTNCDGIKFISGHQKGVAEDIYFVSDDGTKLVEPKKGWEYWHKRWTDTYGGKPEILWDKSHFEG